MNEPFILYDEQTGEVLQNGVGQDPATQADNILGISSMAGYANQRSEYVVNGEIVERPVMTLTVNKTEVQNDGVDEVIITDIPASALVKIKGPYINTKMAVDDGSVEMTFDYEGEYTIQISAFPFLTETINITVL